MSAFAYAFISVLVVSAVSLIGALTLSLRQSFLKRAIFLLVALSVGVLLGDVFIHLLPELFETAGDSLLLPLGVFGGFVVFFVLEKFIHWRHCHSDDAEEIAHHTHSHTHSLAPLVITSDALHNFIDGIIIAAAYLVNIPLGIATTVAVIFHEIPQEIGDFGLMLHSGFSVKKALFYNFLSALTAFLGLGLGWALASMSGQFITVATAVTAGGFLYIAGSDIVPELHKTTRVKESFWQFVAIMVGFAIMFALTLIE